MLPPEIEEQIFYYLLTIDHIDDLIIIQNIYPIWDYYLDRVTELYDLIDLWIPTPKFHHLLSWLTKGEQKRSFMTLHLGRNLTDLTPRMKFLDTLIPEVSDAKIFQKLFTHLTRKNRVYHFGLCSHPSRKNYDLVVFQCFTLAEPDNVFNSMRKGQMILKYGDKTQVLNIDHNKVEYVKLNDSYLFFRTATQKHK